MSNHIIPPRVYFIVFAALMILMAATVVVAQFHLGIMGNVVAMTIAVAKGVLIVLYFMHVKYSSHMTKLFAAAGFVWLLILFAFSLSDYQTRDWEPTRHNFPVEAENK